VIAQCFTLQHWTKDKYVSLRDKLNASNTHSQVWWRRRDSFSNSFEKGWTIPSSNFSWMRGVLFAFANPSIRSA